ncbi:invasin [Salmonella enterica]|nr:invasin [Salmonella enterica subsp. enterica serovar Chester]EAB8019222.1 invasin [Salmonella enterica subsp. enterica serovar Newport]EAP0132838.1 invasin [Salmonella enterica]EBH3089593.1 invasin [Salmonella enterica subsp. enterica serovar Poona]EBS2737951.1 invasin [Salmonella enterica subsp. enterica serovar Richmond]ECB5086776.1 invasin [Salmonella enterica subsp. enterica serovar Hvittingfoss]ECB7316868.1 invasin [Salmonella enterica subsp. enterica serovar Treforest]ECF2403976.1 i
MLLKLHKTKICMTYAVIAGHLFTPASFADSQLPDLGSNTETQSGSSTENIVADYSSNLGQELQNNQSLTDYTKSQVKQLPQNVANDAFKKGMEAAFPEVKFRGGINLEDGKRFRSAEADFLFPVAMTTSDIMFGQLGIRAHDKSSFDGRTFINTGVGYRAQAGEWLWGANSFIDADVKYNHFRGSIGLELYRENIAFSGNYYFPLTGWKESKVVDLHDERPAYGWDIRTKGYLPNYPQLGMELAYEKYYGDKVDILGNGSLNSNPESYSAALIYSPVPLVEFKTGFKDASDSGREANLNLNLKYSFGVPLSEQLDPSKVTAPTNTQNMTEFVDRNYNIVMEYREQKSKIKITMSPVKGSAGDTLFLTPSVSSRYPVEKYEWLGSPELLSGIQNIYDPYSSIMLPELPLDNVNGKEYTLYLRVTDSKGTTVTSDPIPVSVLVNQNAFDAFINVTNEDSHHDGEQYVLPPIDANDPAGMVVSWRFVRVKKEDKERWVSVKPKEVLYSPQSDNVLIESLGGEEIEGDWIEKFRIKYRDISRVNGSEEIAVSINATGPAGIHKPVAKIKTKAIKDKLSKITSIAIDYPAGTIEENGSIDAPVVGTTLTARTMCETNQDCTTDFNYRWEVSDGENWHVVSGITTSTWSVPFEINGVSLQNRKVRVSAVEVTAKGIEM